MKLWMVLFTNKPDMGDKRKEKADAHNAFLQSQPDIKFAGPSTTLDNGDKVDAMWVIGGPMGEKEIAMIVEQDPFYTAGIRESYRVFEYGLSERYLAKL